MDPEHHRIFLLVCQKMQDPELCLQQTPLRYKVLFPPGQMSALLLVDKKKKSHGVPKPPLNATYYVSIEAHLCYSHEVW